MKVYLSVENGPDRCPQEDPRVKSLEKSGWKLERVHYPDGSDGQRAEVELSKEKAAGDEAAAVEA